MRRLVYRHRIVVSCTTPPDATMWSAFLSRFGFQSYAEVDKTSPEKVTRHPSINENHPSSPDHLPGMDPATEALILQIQLEDAQQLLKDTSTDRRDGRFSDADIALKAHQEYLHLQQSTLAAVSQAPAAAEQHNGESLRLICVACDEERPALATFRAPCNHLYCETCLDTFLGYSIADEALFPPRCCNQEIPRASIRLYVSAERLQELARKEIEYSSTDRTYCHEASCSKFILPADITDGRGRCSTCGRTTCTRCKRRDHGNDCPADTATQQVVEMGRQQGWQRCQQCRRLIQLSVGCFHIT